MNIENILRAAWFTPTLNGGWGLPLLFEGPPGVGKSARIEAASNANGLPCSVLVASIREPADFAGLPIPEQRGKTTLVNYAPPAWAVAATGEGRSVVFCDEITTCAPAVQAALLRMILNRALGDFIMSEGTRFVAAANPTHQAAGGWDLAAPLANRFGHLPWPEVDPGDWTEWLLLSGRAEEEHALNPAAEEKRVLALWPSVYAKARGLVVAFVRKRPALLFQMPQTGSAEASKAWPSPRTWEMAARALAGAEIHKLSGAAADILLAAFVGAGAAAEFTAFRKNADLPDPEELLDGKVQFKHNPKRLDRTYAVLSACSALVTTEGGSATKKLQTARLAKLWGLLDEISKDAIDIVVPPAKALIKAPGALWEMNEADGLLTRLDPVLHAAGLHGKGL